MGGSGLEGRLLRVGRLTVGCRRTVRRVGKLVLLRCRRVVLIVLRAVVVASSVGRIVVLLRCSWLVRVFVTVCTTSAHVVAAAFRPVAIPLIPVAPSRSASSAATGTVVISIFAVISSSPVVSPAASPASPVVVTLPRVPAVAVVSRRRGLPEIAVE